MRHALFYMTGAFITSKRPVLNEVEPIFEHDVTKDITIKYYLNKVVIEAPDKLGKEKAFEIISNVSKHLFSVHSDRLNSFTKAYVLTRNKP